MQIPVVNLQAIIYTALQHFSTEAPERKEKKTGNVSSFVWKLVDKTAGGKVQISISFTDKEENFIS